MRKTKLILLIIVFLLVLGTGIYLWLLGTGRIKTGAEVIIGCQGSNQISSFLGSPGANLTTYNLFGQEVSVNEMIVPYLDQVQKEVNAAKTGYSFNTIFTYNNRSKVGGGGKSLHSWGIAIDINPESNPYQPGNYGPPQTDIPNQIIDIFRKYGFVWGGEWPGERDAMHFEWYGARVSGQILDKTSSQKILDVSTDIDGAGSPNANGDFNWLVPFGQHTITAKAKGYKDFSTSLSLSCYSDNTLDIVMEALPANLAGSINGNVKVAGNYPILMPANIYLDGRLVGVSNLRGDFYIPNVREGNHKVEAKVLFFPGGSQSIDLVRGENRKNVNIVIGK